MFEVSELQLDSLAGGDALIGEVLSQGGGQRPGEKHLARGAAKLLAALKQVSQGGGQRPGEKHLALGAAKLLATLKQVRGDGRGRQAAGGRPLGSRL